MMLLALLAAAAPPQAVIDRISRFIEYKVVDDRQLFIRDERGRWHLATFQGGDCPRLTDATRLTFDAAPFDRLDRTSAIVADGSRCPLDSLTRSGPPPKRR